MKLGHFLALILTAGPAIADTSAGIAYLSGASDDARPLALSIWYPTAEPASATIGGNAVFQGAPAALGAALPETRLPLVVLSHGGLRSAADSGAWLGASLARAGFVVVEVNAPRPKDGVAALDEIWRRPADISRAIDLMLGDEGWRARINQDGISVVGFALGATSALSVGGAKMDVDRYMRSCDADGAKQGADCGWYAAQGVAMTQTSRQGLARLIPDPRVTSVVAIAPEYIHAFVAARPDAATILISLGKPDGNAGVLSVDQDIAFPNASVFDAFAVCTKAGPDILREDEGDASLCGGSAQARADIHQALSGAITAFLMDGGK